MKEVLNCRKYLSEVGQIVPGQNDIFAPLCSGYPDIFPAVPVESAPILPQ